MDGTPNRSDRRLSEVTKKLVIPDGIHHTDWGPVYDTCVRRLGIEYDEWQNGIGKILLAKREDGSLAHTIGGLGLSICRQTGKSFMICGALFGLSVNHPGLLAIWTAHHSATSDEIFMSMAAFASRSKIAPFVKKVYSGAGDEEIRFHNGSRIMFGARERGFGRGMSGVDVLVNDEGQIMSQKAMQNMLATMNTSKLGLHIYAGTPPKPEDNCETWMTMHDEAWSDEAVDMAWIEMGADDDADLDDVDQWMKANCSIPHRTPIHSIKRLRRKLDDDGFRREALGIYDANEASVFDIGKWERLIDMNVEEPNRVVLMIDVSPDRRWSSIGVAGKVDDGRTLLMVQELRGTSKTVERVRELREKRRVREVAIFGGGAARVLEPDLVKANIRYEKLTAADMAAAYGNLQKEIKEGTVVHVDQPELNVALANSRTRWLQTGESEAFDRRGHGVNISPAVSAAGALYRLGIIGNVRTIIL